MRIVSTERAETRTFRIHVEDVPLRSMRWDVGGDYQPTEVRIIWTKSVDGMWEDVPHVTIIGVRGAVSSYLEPIVIGEGWVPEWVVNLVRSTNPKLDVSGDGPSRDLDGWRETELTKCFKKITSNGEFLVVWEQADVVESDSWAWERWISEASFIDGDSITYDGTPDCLNYGFANSLEGAQADAEMAADR